jgi:SAM-dependent methyltransferase
VSGSELAVVSTREIDCPACGAPCPSSNRYIIFCESCGHRWLNQSQEDHRAVEASTFTHDYRGYRPDPKYMAATERIARAELVPRAPPPALSLDVGCGAGDFMIVSQSLGYEAEGIDISEASAEICRARGLNVRVADFLTVDFGKKFDLITMWDVVAHLRDPAAFFRRAHSLLTDSGVLFVKTPGFGDLSVMLSDRWPRAAGTLLGAPSHTQYFDRQSLTALLARAGFEPEWIDAGRARSRATGGTLKRRLARQLRGAISRFSGDSNLYVVGRPID